MSSKDPVVRASKFLSLVLRHKPETIGITLDVNGWASIDEILRQSKGRLSREMLDAVVHNNNKQRFGVSDDGLRIRARQGHTLPVDLELAPQTPPEVLWHGTHQEVLQAIQQEGILRMARHHVHLSADLDTAVRVGTRHGGVLVVLRVDARQMHREGTPFYRSENGVWLTDHVPPQYLTIMHQRPSNE